MKSIVLILTGFLLAISDLNGQNSIALEKGDRTWSFQLFGPELMGVNYNSMLSQKLSVNAGLGLWFNMHIGANYYLINSNNSLLYVGSHVCLINELNLGNVFSSYGSQPAVYFPVGIQYVGNKGFTIGFELGYNLIREDYSQANTKPFLFGLKIGHTRKKAKV